jgi:antitoxin component YwqK of YwqJK toxin-antitoxin module
MKCHFFFVFKALILPALISFSSCTDGKVTDGTKIVHFKNSEKIKQEIEYKNGKKNGFFKEYYMQGNLKAIQHYRNDTLCDSSKFYHENGKPSELQIFDQKGLYQGCWKKYNKTGAVFWETCFKDNLIDSTATEYTYKTGKLLKRLNYSTGLKHGKQEEFYANGNKKYISYYIDGKAQPGTEEWYEKGEAVNNDFKVKVIEENKLAISSQLIFYLEPEHFQGSDEAYLILDGRVNEMAAYRELEKLNGRFKLIYDIPAGSFVMEKVHYAVFRKTLMGNTFIKKGSFMVSENNFN